ncbi:hypothetical protein ABT187_49815 [Streptomyces sp. NPDC001817]|uniref:hypothetical protein n=1 Tax=Streptomyces sp. NPDC001817 TaxID=3154398 RepID=UPI00332DE1E0
MTPAEEQLHQCLRAHARGAHSSTAAVELVIAHRRWLHRSDFRDPFLFTGSDFDSGEVTTGIDWPTAAIALGQGRLP